MMLSFDIEPSSMMQPSDCRGSVQWVLDITPANKLDDVDILVYRMLHLSISAIHTSSSSFADAIYDLALHPDIHDELCEEIKTVLTEEGGWNKQALTRMIKMDSFMKESARWHPFLAGTFAALILGTNGCLKGMQKSGRGRLGPTTASLTLPRRFDRTPCHARLPPQRWYRHH